MTWPQKIHRLLTLWLSQIGVNRKIHHETSHTLSKWNDRWNNLIIIITGVASISSFINVSDFNTRTRTILNIIVGALALIASILISIGNKLQWGELSQKHQSMAAEYSELSNLIQTTVAATSKPSASDFMKLITDRINLLQRFGPPLLGNYASIADLPNYILVRDAQNANVGDIIEEEDIKLLMQDSSKEHLEEIVVEDESTSVEIQNINLGEKN